VIPLSWIVGGVAVVAIGGVLAHDHYVTKKLNATRVELRQANANYTALRTAYDHERKIATEASHAYQTDLARLERERSNVPDVRLCKRPASSVPATTAAAERPDAASPPDDGGEASPDIGPALLDYGIACEANQMQLMRLQEWVRAR
jgi:hypothetical protein